MYYIIKLYYFVLSLTYTPILPTFLKNKKVDKIKNVKKRKTCDQNNVKKRSFTSMTLTLTLCPKPIFLTPQLFTFKLNFLPAIAVLSSKFDHTPWSNLVYIQKQGVLDRSGRNLESAGCSLNQVMHKYNDCIYARVCALLHTMLVTCSVCMFFGCRLMPEFVRNHSGPGRGCKSSDQRVCLFVCLSARTF